MKRPPHICYIVMAHHQPNVFHRLLDHIAGPHSDVVVHIDRRSEIGRFRRDASPRVHYLPRRRAVHWCGWSQTRTMLDELAHGLEVSRADYFIFLAGTDFPIKSQSELVGFLERAHPANFINHYPLVPGSWGYRFVQKMRFIDLQAAIADFKHDPALQPTAARRWLLQSCIAMQSAINRINAPRNTRWMDLYHGSTRWCLNRETVAYLVRHAKSPASRRLRRFMQRTSNSDELYFQTAILNSEFRNDCRGFDERECREIFAGQREPLKDEKRVYLHYIDWDPAREDPAILDMRDYERLAGTDKFFACKFVEERSMELIDRLETTLL